MDPRQNPFTPGAGTQPPELAGREEILEDATITLARAKLGRAPKSMLLVGLRGVGKTVLLRRIEDLAQQQDYLSAFVEWHEARSLSEALLPKLRSILLRLDALKNVNERVKKALRVLKSFAKVRVKYEDIEVYLDIDPESGVADSGALDSDLADLMVAVADAAKARGAAVAIIIDEMQFLEEDELSALIMSIHAVAQKGLPLVLMGAGLPQLIGRTGRAKSYAERLFAFPSVGPLSRREARDAIQEPVKRMGVSFSKASVERIFEMTRGYPYFLQEWGYHSWNLADRSPIGRVVIDRASQRAIRKLDESFFRVRLDRLTPAEKRYLRAMAELGPGPHRSGDIAAVLKVRVQSVAPTRSNLIKKGMIYSPSHGDTAFTVPLFDEFLKREIPSRS